MLSFDIRRTPFSRYGSYMALAYLERDGLPLGPGLYLRSLHGMSVVRPELFRITWADGTAIAPDAIEAQPARLVLRYPAGGEAVICFADGRDQDCRATLRIAGRGTPGLRFEMPPGTGVVVHPVDAGRWMVNCRPSYRRYLFEPLSGEAASDSPSEITARHTLAHTRVAIVMTPNAAGNFDLAIDEVASTWVPKVRPSFENCLNGAEADFRGWLARLPEVASEWRPTLTRAAYVDWSCVVAPSGRLQRPAMLMSKNHMNQVWSWDHCFNAMALAYGLPDLAWDQLMIMADHQDAHGAFPDSVNDFITQFNYSKPPVHGWALRFLRRRIPTAFFTRARLSAVYASFSHWARWWLAHRIAPNEQLPHYLHGNDSGWDNSTIFDAGTPLIAPDLAAFLALHCEELSEIAGLLGKIAEAEWWRRIASRLIRELLEVLWREDHFVAMRQFDHKVVESDSLITCLPIVLGERLPSDVRRALVTRIRRFVTEYGVATELPDSPQYVPDGYWRGPIWAPSTLLIVSGLDAVGEGDLARTISRRFCRACAESGFAENFDALTGAGLRDPAYTWTASVFVVLASEFASQD